MSETALDRAVSMYHSESTRSTVGDALAAEQELAQLRAELAALQKKYDDLELEYRQFRRSCRESDEDKAAELASVTSERDALRTAATKYLEVSTYPEANADDCAWCGCDVTDEHADTCEYLAAEKALRAALAAKG